jgi:hypothetical protein
MNEKVREDFLKKKDERFIYALSSENKDKLKELEIFKNKVPFQIKNGWTNLIYELGKDIEEVCKLANCELPKICEIKSKYSSLRFDYYFELNVKVPKIVEKLIDSLIYEAEDKSERICEFCGYDGTEYEDENGTLFTKSCERCKKAEIEKINKERSPFRFRKNRNNWYADELLERVAHIQEHANKKDIDVDKYLDLLDGTTKLIEKIKVKIDEVEFIDFNAEDFTSNEFEKYGNEKRFSKSAIISKYLGTMNKQDIHTLCTKFGKDRVIKELNYDFKAMFEFGFVDIKGLIIPLSGDYKECESFKILLEIVNEYNE